jgi:protein-S-isoprenylcysteine O-methyltransferase Ste14
VLPDQGGRVRACVPTAVWLVIIVWRIRVEERALLAAPGDRYCSYAAHHKRLIPLLW